MEVTHSIQSHTHHKITKNEAIHIIKLQVQQNLK